MADQIILFVLSFLITALMGLISFVWGDINKRMKDLEKDNKDLKTNYLDRFKAVIDLIYEVKILVSEQTAKCSAIQDLKEKDKK